MTVAFILANTDAGVEDEAARSIAKVRGVVEAYVTYGSYDIVAKVEAENTQEVKEIVFSKIRAIDKVRSTLTLVVAD